MISNSYNRDNELLCDLEGLIQKPYLLPALLTMAATVSTIAGVLAVLGVTHIIAGPASLLNMSAVSSWSMFGISLGGLVFFAVASVFLYIATHHRHKLRLKSSKKDVLETIDTVEIDYSKTTTDISKARPNEKTIRAMMKARLYIENVYFHEPGTITFGDEYNLLIDVTCLFLAIDNDETFLRKLNNGDGLILIKNNYNTLQIDLKYCIFLLAKDRYENYSGDGGMEKSQAKSFIADQSKKYLEFPSSDEENDLVKHIKKVTGELFSISYHFIPIHQTANNQDLTLFIDHP